MKPTKQKLIDVLDSELAALARHTLNDKGTGELKRSLAAFLERWLDKAVIETLQTEHMLLDPGGEWVSPLMYYHPIEWSTYTPHLLVSTSSHVPGAVDDE